MKERFWQRPLRDGRVETFVAIEGHFLHVWGDPATTDGLLRRFEEQVGVRLPATIERKPALYGRERHDPRQMSLIA